MRSPTRNQLLVGKNRIPYGLLDTSVIIDIESIELGALPIESSISAVTLAELSAGVPAARNEMVRAIRQRRLQTLESLVDVLSFDASCARAYATIFAAATSHGRKPRGGRAIDYLIAATALSNNLPLYTRNPKDFAGLEKIIDIVSV